jgi:hypothetical protein
MNTQQLVDDKAWEFLFVLGQPRMTGGVQSIINPIAIRRAGEAPAAREGVLHWGYSLIGIPRARRCKGRCCVTHSRLQIRLGCCARTPETLPARLLTSRLPTNFVA